MRVELTKNHAIHTKVLPKGMQLRVRTWLGEELISKGVAIELDGETKEEIVENAMQSSFDNAETPEIEKQSLPNKKKKGK